MFRVSKNYLKINTINMEDFEEKEPVQEENEILVITEDIRSYIYDTAKWAKFLSVIGFVFCVLIVICAFFVPAVISSMTAMGGQSPVTQIAPAVLTVTYLLIGLLYFYPSLMLFKYATAAQKAVLFLDQSSLGIAMSKMKSFFKFWGVFTIVIISFYVIGILFAVVAGIGVS
ncbi:DUF5362 family protein [Pedobacter steynii]|nr:DUF5362 family protein [Pedobacter steynii]